MGNLVITLDHKPTYRLCDSRIERKIWHAWALTLVQIKPQLTQDCVNIERFGLSSQAL